MQYCLKLYYTISVCIVILFYSFFNAYSANDNYPTGARNAAMGNVGVMCPGLWSVSHNQAALGFYNHLTAGFYHENRFALSEFSLHSLAFSLPTGTGTFGLSCSYFGYSAYNESKIGLGFGKALNKKFSAGLQFDWLNTHISDETGNIGAMAIEAGILAKPIKNLSIGLHIFNPTVSSFSNLVREEQIPVIMRLGIGYEYREKVFFAFETEKDLKMNPPFFKAGIEYRIIQNLYARAGVMISNLVSHAAGVGMILKRIEIDLAFSHHQILGYTPHFSIHYIIK